MTFEKVEKKLFRPPAAHNVARLLDPSSEIRTTNNIAKFAVGIPSFNYLPATKVCSDRVALGIDLKTGVNAVNQSGSPAGREQNEKLVRAFFEHDEKRGFSKLKVIESYKGQYRISRETSVPTAPTFTVLENGKQVPIVLCGWKSVDLSREQIRAWLTMLESGLFSYSDYRSSPWEVLLFPEIGDGLDATRRATIIRPGDYQFFSEADMRELATMYARAQHAAIPIARELWQKREDRRREKEREISADLNAPRIDPYPDLFAREIDEGG